MKTTTEKLLIALDIDGTIATHEGEIHEEIQKEVRRVSEEGHQLVLATGRSPRDVLPVLKNVDIQPEFLVCVNGALVLQKDESHRKGYSPIYIEKFNPTKQLETINQYVKNPKIAIEVHGEGYHYTEHFDIQYVEPMKYQKAYEEIIKTETIRAVVVSDHHTHEEIHHIVKTTKVGVVGHSPVIPKTWIEIFGKNVHKGNALEKLRKKLHIPHHNVVAVGDGYNDIQMLQWASQGGRSVAMGQAPEDIKKHAKEVAPSVTEFGVAWVLQTI